MWHIYVLVKLKTFVYFYYISTSMSLLYWQICKPMAKVLNYNHDPIHTTQFLGDYLHMFTFYPVIVARDWNGNG